jgi:hypothetical protein
VTANPKRLLFAGCALLALGIPVLLELTTPRFAEATLQPEFGPSESIVVPFSKTSRWGIRRYSISGQLAATALGTRRFRVIADDCVEGLAIDHTEVSLAEVPRELRCEIKSGFLVDLKPHIAPGENTVEARILDNGGDFGFHFMRGFNDPWSRFWILAWAAALGALAAMALRRWGFSKPAIAIVVVGLVARIFYLDATAFAERSHDVWDHVKYIMYVAEKAALPPNEACFECHQPPLYYVLAGAVFGLARVLKTGNPFFYLQLLSLLASFGFVFFAAATVRRVCGEKPAGLAALALAVLWPSGIIHAPRLGNDSLLYCLYAGSIYFTNEWWRSANRARSSRELLWAAALALAALCVKVSGITALFLIGILLVFAAEKRAGARRWIELFRAHQLTITLVVAGCLAFAGFTLYRQHIGSGAELVRFNKFNLIGGHLRLRNSPLDFVRFDVLTFLREPFTNGLDDAMGRQLYWNFFLKTSLFGEWSLHEFPQRQIAIVLSVLYFGLMGLALAGLARFNRKDLRELAVPVLMGAILLPLSMLYRYLFPIAANSDFRFILPTVITWSALTAKGLEFLNARYPRGARAALALVATFCLLSFVFCSASWFQGAMPLWRVKG